MVKDKMKLQMRVLKLISMTSIGVGLWVLIDQIVTTTIVSISRRSCHSYSLAGSATKHVV